jgi:hypothetical protein
VYAIIQAGGRQVRVEPGQTVLVDGTAAVVDIRTELAAVETYDVMEVADDRVLVSSAPEPGTGTAYIVLIDGTNGNAASRVAGARAIMNTPHFGAASDRSSIYVSDGIRPNYIFRLDAAQPNFPIVGEHRNVPAGAPALSGDGTRLYVTAGQTDADVYELDTGGAALVGVRRDAGAHGGARGLLVMGNDSLCTTRTVAR